MIKVNAIGEVCPKPVIMTKKALKEIESGVVEVSVDNITSKENVEKMAKEMGHTFETREEGNVFIITITKAGEKQENSSEEENIKKRKRFLKYFYPLTIDKICYEKYLKKEIEELNKKYEVTLVYQAICNLILKYRLKNEKRDFKNWREIDVLEYLLQTPETFKSIYPNEKHFSLGKIESQIKFQNKKGEK